MADEPVTPTEPVPPAQPSAAEQAPAKKRSRFWRVVRVVYPFVVLALLYVIWRDVLPVYRVLTRPVSPDAVRGMEPQVSEPYAAVPGAGPEVPSSRSLLDAAPTALPAFKEAVEKVAPRSAEAHVGLGLLYESKGKPDEAVRYYRKAVELDRSLPVAHFRLGYALWQKKDMIGAQRAFERAIEADASYVPARYGLAGVMQAVGNTRQAELIYQDIFSADAGEYQALNNLGILYEDRGDLPRAMGCYESAANLKPNDPVVAENARQVRELYSGTRPAVCVEERIVQAYQKRVQSSAPADAPAPEKKPAAASGEKRSIKLANGQSIFGVVVERTAGGIWVEAGDGARVFLSRSELASPDAP